MAVIPSDVTLEAALYGSQHADTLIMLDKVDRVLEILKDRLADAIAGMDLELATDVIDTVPEYIVMDDDPDEDEEPYDPPEWAAETIDRLRYIERYRLAVDMVSGWRASIVKRGRYYGITEHGVRINISGRADDVIKTAADRWEGRP